MDQQDGKFSAVLDYLRNLVSKLNGRSQTELLAPKQWTRLCSKLDDGGPPQIVGACNGAPDSDTTSSQTQLPPQNQMASLQDLAVLDTTKITKQIVKPKRRKGPVPLQCEHGKESGTLWHLQCLRTWQGKKALQVLQELP